jgi:hypothetical protein
MYTQLYPIGFPEVITENFLSIDNYFGIVACTILPPRGLYLPVLPIRATMEKSEKLVFGLCNECIITQYQGKCKHNDNKRALKGYWTTPEINKAIEMGYKMVEIYEIWNYGKNVSSDLFKGYIRTFLKTKMEASGYPDKCTNDQEKDDYIEQVYQKTGIELDEDKIENNKGRKNIAKLCLNNLWGKFSQRLMYSQTKYHNDFNKFYSEITDINNESVALLFMTDKICCTQSTQKKDLVARTNRNAVIACFTTSYARLKLYSILEKLGERVCYFDTDSVVFVDDGKVDIDEGTSLGEWEDEMKKCITCDKIPKIVEFVSGGPKNYSIATNCPHTSITKVKGFSLSSKNSLTINTQSMKDMIYKGVDGENKPLTVKGTRFNKDYDGKVYTMNGDKDYNFIYDKRVVVKKTDSIIDTKPYGY